MSGEDIFGEDDNGDGDQPVVESGAEVEEGCNSSSDVVRLRGCWCKLRSDICSVFRLVMDSAWNDSNRERPDLAGATRALVAELCARSDPHALYLKIEEIVRRFAAEVRASLSDLMERQSKDPNLAQDFVAAILDNYEKMCSAAAHLAPALADLDQGHLQRFSVTWDIAVKRVYQDVVYSDSLVQNNLPIFVSQVNQIKV